MSANKKTKKTKKTNKQTNQSTPQGALSQLKVDSKPAVVVAHLQAKYALLEEDKQAFETLVSDAKRSELGKKTKATNVLENAARWAVEIDKQLTLYPAALADYPAPRFAYFLNRIDRLERRLDAGAKDTAQVVESRLGEDDARKNAVRVRADLLSRMNRFAGQREVERGEIGAQQGVIEGDGLRTSLIGLCNLVGKWLGRTDSINVRLLKHAGLSSEMVANAKEAASAIGSAGGKAALEGSKVVRDPPLVNLDEGGVLFEMDEVMEVFDLAAEQTKVVQRLVPNASIRHVFIHPAGKKPVAEPAATPGKTSPETKSGDTASA